MTSLHTPPHFAFLIMVRFCVVLIVFFSVGGRLARKIHEIGGDLKLVVFVFRSIDRRKGITWWLGGNWLYLIFIFRSSRKTQYSGMMIATFLISLLGHYDSTHQHNTQLYSHLPQHHHTPISLRSSRVFFSQQQPHVRVCAGNRV